MSYTDSGFS